MNKSNMTRYTRYRFISQNMCNDQQKKHSKSKNIYKKLICKVKRRKPKKVKTNMTKEELIEMMEEMMQKEDRPKQKRKEPIK